MNDTIDLSKFFLFTFKNIKSFIYSFIFFILLFFFYYQLFNKNFVTYNQLLLTQSSLATASPFAALSGIGIDFSNDENIVDSKILYDLISTDYFLDKLINSTLLDENLKKNGINNFYDYYLIYVLSNKNDSLDSKIDEIRNFYRNSISYYFDNDKKILEVNVSTPDPILSKLLNESFGNSLNDYITEINQKRYRSIFEFLNNELIIKKNEYDDAANNYYSFLEKNQNISKKTLIALEQRLQLEFQLKYELYKNIQVKYQETEIKIKTTYNTLSQLFPIESTEFPNQIPFISTLFYFIISSILFSYLFLIIRNFFI